MIGKLHYSALQSFVTFPQIGQSHNLGRNNKRGRQVRCRAAVNDRDDFGGSPDDSDSELPEELLWQTRKKTATTIQVLTQSEESDKDSDLDLLQALMKMQNEGIQRIAIFGTRNMPHTHQQLVELLSFAIAQTDVKLFTSGAVGTNAAVIRGVLNANKENNLTVILPQSLSKQPEESQELLKKVPKVIQMSENDGEKLVDASRLCNRRIISEIQQLICFAYHDSHQMMAACTEAKQRGKIVTEFFLD